MELVLVRKHANVDHGKPLWSYEDAPHQPQLSNAKYKKFLEGDTKSVLTNFNTKNIFNWSTRQGWVDSDAHLDRLFHVRRWAKDLGGRRWEPENLRPEQMERKDCMKGEIVIMNFGYQ